MDDLTGQNLRSLIIGYKSIRDQIKKLEKRQELNKADIRRIMTQQGESEITTDVGTVSVTESTRKGYSAAELEALVQAGLIEGGLLEQAETFTPITKLNVK